MPLPQFTEEDYKAAEREYAGKAPKKDAPSQRGAYTYPTGTKTVGGKPRSLFHMDDDDYVARMEEEAKKEEEDGEKQQQNQAGASKLDLSAKLKRDDKDNQKDGE